MIDFGPAFETSNGGPIQFEGRTLYMSYWLPVVAGDHVLISFIRSTKRMKQGFRVTTRGKGCILETNGQRLKDIVLWTDTAPPEVDVFVAKAKVACEVGFWNVWEEPKYGMMMYALTSAAMQVDEQGDGSLLVRCSDGSGEPEFDDLIVRVRHLHAGTDG